MPVYNFDVETWNEFLRRGGPHWQLDFLKEWKKIQEQIQEQKKYDEVWELIKKENHWS